MKYILGQKIKMSQIFDKDGKVIPVTIVRAGPVTITQIKNLTKDKYSAVQVGFGEKKKITKPLAGHLKNLGNFRWLREYKLKNSEPIQGNVGDKIKIDIFQEGDMVKVTGISKGKGFAGVVKRHHFRGGPASHGHKDNLRMPGAIGAGGMQHVLKGTRMGGRMGGEKVSVRNLQVLKVDKENNILMLKGAVPGTKTGLVEIILK